MHLYKFRLCPPEQININDDDTRHEIYKPFLTKYFHQKETFPTGSEAAQYFEDFNKAKLKK